MKVIIFGASGMVGQGALRACLRDSRVSQVLLVGRRPIDQTHFKIRELIQPHLFSVVEHENALKGYDTCLFCLGTSSSGMSEAKYTLITYDLTLTIAKNLSRLNPEMTFVYVSGAGTDESEQGRTMWARVKGRTENALRALPFKAVYLFRPGVIQPLDGIRSKTRSYRWFYALTGPLMTIGRQLFPQFVLTTDTVGRAMLAVAHEGGPQPVLSSADIYRLTR